MFVSKCLTSDNSLVNFVVCHSIYVLRENSPVGSNALWCCMRFGLRLDMLKLLNRNFVSLYAYNVTASVIYDLLCVKSHLIELSILGAADIDLIIESLCVS